MGFDPVLWRELRQPMFPKKRLLVAVVLLLALLIGLLYWRIGLDNAATHYSVFVIGVALFLLQATFLSTGGVTGERETRTWDVLLTTRVPPGRLLTAKLLGALRRQWLIPGVLGAHVVASLLVNAADWRLVPPLALVLAGSSVMLCGLGLLYSLLFRKTISAAAANLATAMVLWLGSMIALALTQELFNLWGNEFFDGLLTAAMLVNPVAMAGILVEAFADGWVRPNASPEFGFPSGDFAYGLGLFLTTVAAVLQAVIGLGAVGLARLVFNRFAPRAS